MPLLVGAFSDLAGYVTALAVPAPCYGLLCLFALSASRSHSIDEVTAPMLH